MTRVNLLRRAPDRRGYAVSAGRRWRGLATSGACLALIAGLVWWWSLLQRTGTAVEADLLHARQELARLRTTIARTDTQNRLSEALLQRIGVLETLRAGQSTPLAVLEAIGSSVPGDCWLTAVAYERARPVRVEGRAEQLESIFEFAERLEASRAFDGGVRVVESHLETHDREGPMVAFSLEALSESRDRARSSAALPARRPAGSE